LNKVGKAAKQVLLTVSGTIPANIGQVIADGKRPRADYLEIARGLGADILDYPAARTATGMVGSLLETIGGPNLRLAYACWRLRGHYEAILTDGEQVGLPLAALMKMATKRRPRHVMIVHILSVPKKMLLLDWLGLRHYIDRFLVYSRWQKQFIEERWSVPAGGVVWTPFMVDHRFFASDRVVPRQTRRPQICAV
jgi:hypothetical protein